MLLQISYRPINKRIMSSARLFRKLFHFTRRLRKIFFLYWNRLKFSLIGISYGECLSVINSIYVEMDDGSKISIGDNFQFLSGDCLNPLIRNMKGCFHTSENAEINIGNNTGMSGAILWAEKSISIGDNVKIGANTIVLDSDTHSLNYVERRTVEDRKNALSKGITISDDVLIGVNCIILKGVTIGARSIIAAGSVVTKDIPSDCIAGGNPAKIIRRIQQIE